MLHFISRVCHAVDRTLDPLYNRWAWLQRSRLRVGHWKHTTKQKIHDRCYAESNLPALQALAQRRFDESACATAQLAAPPAQWPMIDVSIVMYNSERWLVPFLTSLRQQAYPLDRLHLCFVDHGSTDQTVSLTQQLLAEHGALFASAQLIEQDNLGFGAGHDRAIQAGKSPYCLVTNLDLEFEPDAIVNAMRMALSDADSTVACWEFRQVPYEHPKYYDPVTLECNWSSHACILLRRAAYEQVGGYEPRIFMYCEDVELSYRFRSYGYALKYVPKAVVHHYTYESAGQVKPVQYAGGFVGNMYLRLRYGSGHDAKRGLLLYLLFMLRSQPFAGARAALWAGFKKVIANWGYFKKGKGPVSAHFAFYGLDFEFARQGPFWVCEPVTAPNPPLVSIITRTYQGRSALLQQTMRSVLNQTYPHIELIVVEDGGNTQQAVVEHMATQVQAGQSVRFIANPKEGRSSAGNTGLAAAQGRWLMFLDDDDLIFADHIETLAQALIKNTHCSAAYALALEVQTDMAADRQSYTEEHFNTPQTFFQEWDYTVLEHHNFIPIQAILFQRERYEKWGGFDVELDQLEDWHVWLRYGYGQSFCYVPKTTSLFRSPAKLDVRTDRALLLHEAYHEAKNRARQCIESATVANPK